MHKWWPGLAFFGMPQSVNNARFTQAPVQNQSTGDRQQRQVTLEHLFSKCLDRNQCRTSAVSSARWLWNTCSLSVHTGTNAEPVQSAVPDDFGALVLWVFTQAQWRTSAVTKNTDFHRGQSAVPGDFGTLDCSLGGRASANLEPMWWQRHRSPQGTASGTRWLWNTCSPNVYTSANMEPMWWPWLRYPQEPQSACQWPWGRRSLCAEHTLGCSSDGQAHWQTAKKRGEQMFTGHNRLTWAVLTVEVRAGATWLFDQTQISRL